MNSSLNDFDFTDGEIKEQLELLGFKNVSQAKFNSFKEDLRKLIENERSSEESQIFNQRLNKIQKEKLVNHENDSWDDDLSDNTEITIPSPRPYQYSNNIAKNKMIKRKVARKQSNDLFEENLVDTVKMSREINRDSYLSNSLEQLTLEDRNVNSALNKLTSDSKISFTNENQVKSFIRPRSQTSLSTRFEDPSRIRKNNPVRKYHEYSQIWAKQKAPGEKNHNGLRWNIREKMLEKHVIVKKHKNVHHDNDYIVPTEKKRQDLRWSIRNAMAYNN